MSTRSTQGRPGLEYKHTAGYRLNRPRRVRLDPALAERGAEILAFTRRKDAERAAEILEFARRREARW